MMLFLVLLFDLAAAAPFVTTWRTTAANETTKLPTIHAESDLTIDWGDLTPTEFFANGSGVLTHVYASPNAYTVSIEGQFSWDPWFMGPPSTANQQLIDIVSWGDGIKVIPWMFAECRNMQVSAPPNTQPVFPPNSDITALFENTAFNSSLDWDLLNITSISKMFWNTPVNLPLTFRNTQGVQSIGGLFRYADQFNQPFHFDASSVTDAFSMFESASSFNSVLNLSNSSQLSATAFMFKDAVAFNQPITFNTSSVTTMTGMFQGATNFNQPINFDTSLVTSMLDMFSGAVSFNQPVVLNTSSVTSMNDMFSNASSFASTVNFTSTAGVIEMADMFDGADLFTQDLSGWDTEIVTQCNNFCRYCGLSTFPSCDPCGGSPRLTNEQGVSVCSIMTASPSSAPSTAAPSVAPSVAAPSVAPSVAPTTVTPDTVSPAAAAVPSLACGLLLVLALLGFRL